MTTSLWKLLGDYNVVIPILQRDYAQGRTTGKAPVIREKFLNALHKAIYENTLPLELDFVYGNTNHLNSKQFIPIDGQQRLTTLFLLHWYIAAKENKLDEAKNRLGKFTYQTRHSSKVFCEQLVKYYPLDISEPISETIVNQPWFFTTWINDPTVSAMLTMLTAIQTKFKEIENAWSLLTSESSPIVFHLLPMDKLGLPEDLYIKMNSRGKELTDFEHFKSQFSELLEKEDAEYFNENIDQRWSDLFWGLFKDQDVEDIAKLVDNGFLRFFRYITDIVIAKNNILVEKTIDEFDVFRVVYGKAGKPNVQFLFKCLDVFFTVYTSNPDFFTSSFYVGEGDYDKAKVRLFFQSPQIDLFKKCTDCYSASGRNPFSIGEQLLLFACIEHLINETGDFSRRLRKLRNLIANSDDEVRQENMSSLLLTVSELIKHGIIVSDTKFNKRQVSDEITKEDFMANEVPKMDIVFRVEDHHLLQGCLAVFNLDDDLRQYSEKFIQIFSEGCNYDKISRALLCFGDYSQKHGTYRQLGSDKNPLWRALFTPSQRRLDFQNTKDALRSLISDLVQNGHSSLDTIIETYLSTVGALENGPRDWRYYYIKYAGFRKNEDGFYYWSVASKQYESIMMRRSTLGGFHWCPFLYMLKSSTATNLSLENYGSPLTFSKGNVLLVLTNCNQGFNLKANDDASVQFLQMVCDKFYPGTVDTVCVKQNESGIDIEDRIEFGKKLIANLLEFSTS